MAQRFLYSQSKTWVLLIILVCSCLLKFPIHGQAIYAHRVQLFSKLDFENAGMNYFNYWLPRIESIKRGDLSIISDNGSGEYYCPDPRSTLCVLWDDLSSSDREEALHILGYPPKTTLDQLFHGPHPHWFSTTKVNWYPESPFLLRD